MYSYISRRAGATRYITEKRHCPHLPLLGHSCAHTFAPPPERQNKLTSAACFPTACLPLAASLLPICHALKALWQSGNIAALLHPPYKHSTQQKHIYFGFYRTHHLSLPAQAESLSPAPIPSHMPLPWHTCPGTPTITSLSTLHGRQGAGTSQAPLATASGQAGKHVAPAPPAGRLPLAAQRAVASKHAAAYTTHRRHGCRRWLRFVLTQRCCRLPCRACRCQHSCSFGRIFTHHRTAHAHAHPWALSL